MSVSVLFFVGVMMVGLLLALVGQPLTGRLSDRTGARPLATVGGLLVIPGFLPFALGVQGVLAVIGLVVVGFGLGAVASATMGSVFRTVSRGATSRATSALFIVHQIGGALGIALLTLVLQRAEASAPLESAFRTTFWWLVAAGAVIAVAARILPVGPAQPVPDDDQDRPSGPAAPAPATADAAASVSKQA
ncbi:MFS transporter [Streptomyces sp. NPDC004610]|uniref:MFS transporter n=1 Tax=unclassified Streptomyces TaxID=2593676 RepID=UPI00339FB484